MAYYEREHPYDSMRQRPRRPVTDYGSTMVQYMRSRKRGPCQLEQERPSASYIVDMLPPIARTTCPADTLPAKLLHSSLNKIKHPVNVVKWTPEGRRLLTGSSSGEFTLWNGMGFNFETIMSAHESAVRAAAWSHNDDWLVSADQDGMIKYWQPNFNNVKEITGHDAPIRDLSFSPTDAKFVTASDDATLKIWDFAGGVEESTLTGHGWDAKTVDWHPTKGLLVSGSKDHQVKLWDPRTGRCLTTLHGHKSTISKASFEPNRGQLLATCARDSTARIFDLRMMRDVFLLKGHERDIMTLSWHPIHYSLLSTGGGDGSLFHYLLDEPNPPTGTPLTLSPFDSPDPSGASAQTIFPAHRVQYAHESAIWSLDWHPLGHILASGSNDRITRFWSRARPGDTACLQDKHHLGESAQEPIKGFGQRNNRQAGQDEDDDLDDEADGLVDQKMPARQQILPGLPAIAAALNGGSQIQLPGMGSALPPIPPPNGLPGMPPMPLQFGNGSMIPDLSKLQEMFRNGQVPPPPPGHNVPPSFAPHPNIGMPPMPAPGFPGFANGFPQPGQLPPGFPPPPPGFPRPDSSDGRSLSQSESTDPRALRRRIPLPSQQDGFKQEQQKGNFRVAR